jgi:hypothetical protein
VEGISLVKKSSVDQKTVLFSFISDFVESQKHSKKQSKSYPKNNEQNKLLKGEWVSTKRPM